MRFSAVTTAAVVAVLATAAPAQQRSAAKPVTLDRNVLHVQVILDMLGFGPGVLDGKGGQSLVAAIKGFQEARGLPKTGKPDAATLSALNAFRTKRPTVQVTLTRDVMAGPYVGPLPKDYTLQAKLPTLGYARPLEKLSEMFHTTPATLVALNPGVTQITVGSKLIVPNTVPSSRDYDPKLSADWRQTLASLNVDPKQPKADHIVVDKSDGVLRVLDAQDRLIAQFSATMGSEHDPLPLGTWKIYGSDYNPKFKYNPALFWDAKKGDDKELLPAGPNGPVGVVWMDLSKEHYGIHGTPHPETIGRSESHGCIRLTNWDAARLAMMIKPGIKAVFKA